MLEKYKTEHEAIYQILNNSIKDGRYSHAYLFGVNDYDYATIFIKDFIKELIASDNNDSIYEKIDEDTLEEIKIIEPDGSMIKKEQILELHEWIKTKPLIIPHKIAIIKKACDMNKYSANSLLKILEEPPEGLMFFLLTDDSNNILPTIKSRLQLIRLKKEGAKSTDFIDEFINTNINCNYSKDEVNNMIKLMLFIEKNSIDKIFVNENYIKWFEEREDVDLFLDLIIYIYNKALTFKMTGEKGLKETLIDEIAQKNDKDGLIQKIKITMDLKAKIDYNINTLLLRDYLIIRIKEVL